MTTALLRRLERLEAALPASEDNERRERRDRLQASVRHILDAVPRGPIGSDRDAPLRELLQRGDAGTLTEDDRAVLSGAPECHVPPLDVVRALVKLMDEV